MVFGIILLQKVCALIWIITPISLFLLVASILPLISQPHGVFRTFEFPRMQLAFLAVGSIATTLLVLPNSSAAIWIISMLLLVLALQLSKILRFTPIWPRRSVDFDGDPQSTPCVRLMVCNVKQSNTNVQAVCDLIEKHDPDIAVFVETDQRWIDALKDSASKYKYQLAQPMDNTYGMFLISKLRLLDHQIRFLLNEEVPSFDAMVEVGNGDKFRLITVHPEPPLPNNDTIARDAEIAFVGKLVRHDDHPVIVTGDLNDVAWSTTTRRFLRLSRLVDPREGRGQYNTFDARFFFMRWPLDHLFHSPHFQLINLKRLPFVGSDHFPMLYDLALTSDENLHRKVEPASQSDHDDAIELIDIEKRRDSRPTGVDWEKD